MDRCGSGRWQAYYCYYIPYYSIIMGLDPMDIVGLPDPHKNSDTEYFVGPPLQDRPAVDIPPSWGCLSAVVVEVPLLAPGYSPQHHHHYCCCCLWRRHWGHLPPPCPHGSYDGVSCFHCCRTVSSRYHRGRASHRCGCARGSSNDPAGWRICGRPRIWKGYNHLILTVTILWPEFVQNDAAFKSVFLSIDFFWRDI